MQNQPPNSIDGVYSPYHIRCSDGIVRPTTTAFPWDPPSVKAWKGCMLLLLLAIFFLPAIANTLGFGREAVPQKSQSEIYAEIVRQSNSVQRIAQNPYSEEDFQQSHSRYMEAFKARAAQARKQNGYIPGENRPNNSTMRVKENVHGKIVNKGYQNYRPIEQSNNLKPQTLQYNNQQNEIQPLNLEDKNYYY